MTRVVASQREDQRDVDADRLGQAGGDRGQALARGRDLDEQVRPVDRPPQCPRLGDGGPGVVREPRVDLDRHPPVHAARRVVDGAEDIARPAHVERGQRPQPLARPDAAGSEVTQLRLVRAALGDRPGEDCRVRRYPGDMIAGHQVSQAARGQPVAAQVIQPDRNARFGQRRQWVGHAGLLPRLAAAARMPCRPAPCSLRRHPRCCTRILQLPFRSARLALPVLSPPASTPASARRTRSGRSSGDLTRRSRADCQPDQPPERAGRQLQKLGATRRPGSAGLGQQARRCSSSRRGEGAAASTGHSAQRVRHPGRAGQGGSGGSSHVWP